MYCDAAAAAAAELEEDEDLIEIAEEADLIQAERFIEDDWGFRGDRDAVRQKNIRDAVRTAEDLMLAIDLDKEDIQPEKGFEVKLENDTKSKCWVLEHVS